MERMFLYLGVLFSFVDAKNTSIFCQKMLKKMFIDALWGLLYLASGNPVWEPTVCLSACGAIGGCIAMMMMMMMMQAGRNGMHAVVDSVIEVCECRVK